MKPEFQITYFLWSARKDKEGRIPLYIRSKQNSDKQTSYNTGIKLHSSEWSKKRREPKNKPASLLDLERKLKATYRDLAGQGYEPDLPMLLKRMNDSRTPTDRNIIAWCNDYLKGPYSKGQKKAARTLRSNLEDYNPTLTFDRLTRPRIKAFFAWLTEKGVANNSQYKRLRALINVAGHANLNIPHLTAYRLPYSTKNALKVRLTWAEVKGVINTAPENEKEAMAKDVFLLACFSGLRISDILTLNKGQLHDYFYERVQTKTKTPVMVTVHKYNEHLFRRFIDDGVKVSRQWLSDALKDLLKRCPGMAKEVVKIQAVGYEHRETVVEKWREISFHSGRRFYSRLLNDLGLGNEIARDELGHSFKSVTELYSGSPDHVYRVSRVRKAMESLEETMKTLSLMKVA